MEEPSTTDRNYGRGHLAPSRNVRQIVMGAGRGRPPYDWSLDDSWAGVMPPEQSVPDFLADFVLAAELEPADLPVAGENGMSCP
jgi:hypothetical protein